MKRIIFVVCLFSTGLSAAGESRFSLNIAAWSSPSSLSAAGEAQMALWDDPMIRLQRAMNAEMGRLLVGQPGGRTPPLIMVGVGGGLPPRILRAAFENSIARDTVPPPAIVWPWLKEKEPAAPPMEEQLALLLGQRLELKVGS